MYENELYHYGVVGMKWGVRRYRNADGKLTTAGKKQIKKLNKLNRTVDYDRDSRRLTEKNIQRFSGKTDPVSKILTKTNKTNLSHLNKVIERNETDIKRIIGDMQDQKVDIVIKYDPYSNRMYYKQSDRQQTYAKDNKL